MLTVHHLGKSRSEGIVRLCEELDIGYELKTGTRDPVRRRTCRIVLDERWV